MTPTMQDVYALAKAHQLVRAIRGEACVFVTPPEANGEMFPTDHVELLDKALYPMAAAYPPAWVERELDVALRVAPVDALGTFCAIQCYYVQVVHEKYQAPPIRVDRRTLPQLLAARYMANLEGLKALRLTPADTAASRQTLALSYLRLLQREHGIVLTG